VSLELFKDTDMGTTTKGQTVEAGRKPVWKVQVRVRVEWQTKPVWQTMASFLNEDAALKTIEMWKSDYAASDLRIKEASIVARPTRADLTEKIAEIKARLAAEKAAKALQYEIKKP
jgi:hypothetical protein